MEGVWGGSLQRTLFWTILRTFVHNLAKVSDRGGGRGALQIWRVGEGGDCKFGVFVSTTPGLGFGFRVYGVGCRV